MTVLPDWARIKSYGEKAGLEVLALAEAAYLTFKDPRTPLKSQAVILIALLYFLAPIDALPDFLPGGFGDDISVLLGALATVGSIGKKHLDECRLKRGLVVKVRQKDSNES